MMKSATLSAVGIGGGMRVAVRRGEIPLELLAAQDEAVALRAGAFRRVAVRPCESAAVIRIEAQAFGPARPHHELTLGPDTAIRVTDPAGASALVPARLLVNGATVTELPGAGQPLWELHLVAGDADDASVPDLVLVEGLAVGTAGIVAHTQSGHAVAEARRSMLAQAAILGWRRSADVDFHVVAEGRRLPAAVRRGSLLAYDLPEPGVVALRSIAAMPMEVEADSADTRLLGVAISRLALDGQEIALDDPALGRGFYGIEQDEAEDTRSWRWTDGDAQLRLERAGRLEVTLHLVMKPWMGPREALEPALAEVESATAAPA